MEKINVLIADDMEYVSDMIKIILEENKKVHIVGIATNGKDEYQKILDLQPDIVITDNNMPYIDGIEIIGRVNCDINIKKKPKFILMTGNVTPELSEKARELNVLNVIHKPISSKDILLNIIDEYIKEENE